MAGTECHGREEEIAIVAAGLARAESIGGQIVMVEGPDGMGKSTLIAAAADMARSGFRTLTVRCEQSGRDLPFAAVRQLFLSLPAQQRQELLSPQLIALFDDPAGAHGDQAILPALLRLARSLCDQQPLALLMDDVQWADDCSLSFLEHLASWVSGLRCYLAAAIREPPGAWGSPLAPAGADVPDAVRTVLRPGPLSVEDSGRLLGDRLVAATAGDPPEEAFVRACHAATGGNPRLLADLADTLVARGIAPVAVGAERVSALAAEASARTAAEWLTRIPRAHASIAEAIAILGPEATMAEAAALDGLPAGVGTGVDEELRRLGGIPGPAAVDRGRAPLSPPVRNALYQAIEPVTRAQAHRRAAAQMLAAGDLRRAAGQLLQTPPAADVQTVRVLLRAADEAMARGEPQEALRDLQRCLAEPPEPELRADVLFRQGRARLLLDIPAAEDSLIAAHRLSSRSRRAEIALDLGIAMLMGCRGSESLKVWQQALDDPSTQDEELRHRLQASVLTVPLYEPGQQESRGDILRRVAALGQQRLTTPGGRTLACVIAAHYAVLGDPQAVPRVLRAIGGGAEDAYPTDAVLLAPGWLVLVAAERDEAVEALEEAVAGAERDGSLTALLPALACRASALLSRGRLAEAEDDARRAVEAVEATSAQLWRSIVGPLLGDVLMEQGRLGDAESALKWAHAGEADSTRGLAYHLLHSLGRLHRLRGRPAEGLEAQLAAGRSFGAAGGQNPALVPWQSEAALCFHRLGHSGEGLPLAREELRLARNWSARPAWGRALRVVGAVQPPEEGLVFLSEAVFRLRESSARLEYAKALAARSTALRRLGRTSEAGEVWAEAAELAQRCGARLPAEEEPAEPAQSPEPADLASGFLAAPSQAATPEAAPGATDSGPRTKEAPQITVSENRACELAAAGRTNRQIATELSISVKAVELRLSNAYRKLGINGRRQLGEALSRSTRQG
ncbi:LuxR family transcriptional regulator [Kitasatospora sp. MBT63]|uniref:LuxR family transcriptional regulator n=1 Tax=Kitasatospora sp. MBT63 TaxID=1444768 RepID=UPI0009E66E15|nr:LuxR family transcriptional regulator [Kitasatospora sp. MBT63]